MFDVRRVSPDRLVDLRHRVLRADLPRDAAIVDGDDEPTALHFAAFDARGAIVGCATLMRRPREGRPAWQLRGMAVAPELRRSGVGAMLLAEVDRAVRESDLSRSLWCNARVVAIPFYEANGWRSVSDVFDIPTAGPHRVMIRSHENESDA